MILNHMICIRPSLHIFQSLFLMNNELIYIGLIKIYLCGYVKKKNTFRYTDTSEMTTVMVDSLFL